MSSYSCLYDNSDEHQMKIILKEYISNDNIDFNNNENSKCVSIDIDFINNLMNDFYKKKKNINLYIQIDNDYEIYDNKNENKNIIFNESYLEQDITKYEEKEYYLKNNKIMILDNDIFEETRYFFLNLLNFKNVNPFNLIIKNLDTNEYLLNVFILEYDLENKSFINAEVKFEKCTFDYNTEKNNSEEEDDNEEENNKEDDDNEDEDDNEDDNEDDDNEKDDDEEYHSQEDYDYNEDDDDDFFVELNNDIFKMLRKYSNISSLIKLKILNKNKEIVSEENIDYNSKFINNLILKNVENNYENINFNKKDFIKFLVNIKFFYKYSDIYNFYNRSWHYFLFNYRNENKIANNYFDKFVNRHHEIIFDIITYIFGFSMFVLFLSNFVSSGEEYYL